MGKTASGGVAAAAGLGFQYLATVDALLEHLETHEGDFVLITEDPRNEVIDFSLSIQGAVQLSVQAKASVDGPEGRPITPAEILDTAGRLVQDPAERYEIRTNRRLTQDAAALVATLRSIDPNLAPTEIRRLLADVGVALPKVDDNCLPRLVRLDVASTGETDEEFAERIVGRVLALRRAGSRGGGRDSARVLLRYLVAEVLHRSGRRTERTLTRDTALELLGLSERSLAHCLGRYDSGNPIGPFPALRTVHRGRLLDEVLGILGARPAERTVRRLALLGLSGTGKSTLAASFCEIASSRYDHMLWIDASNEVSVRNQIARILGQPVGEVTTEEVASNFRHLLAESSDCWVIVFDNATDARVVSPWLPVRGHVDAVVTSTNSARWSTWRRVVVGVMTEDEAVDVVRLRLQLTSLTREQHDSAVRLVRGLDWWPLAVELACSFLVNAGKNLEFTDGYLQLLTEQIIDDDTLAPSEYHSHPTLLQAVLVALDTVRATGPSTSGLDATALLDVLAYLPPRSAPIELAGRIALATVAQRRTPSEPLPNNDVVSLAIDNAVRRLATASLVQRYDSDDGLGPRTRTNAIVLDLVRRLQVVEHQTAVLDLLQVTLSEFLSTALEMERYPFTAALVASSQHVLKHARECDALTLPGIIIPGNLANFWLRRGKPDQALHAFRQELDLVENTGIDAPLLRSKIHVGILTCQLSLDAGSGELSTSIELTLSAAEQSVSDEQRAPASYAEVAGQLIEVLHALRRSTTFTRGDEIDGWWRRTLLLAPCADDDHSRREAQEALRDPNNDDEATLAFYEAELEKTTGVHRRLELLFKRADTLTLLHRYHEAADAFQYATALSREQSLGLAPGWTSVFNAWLHASVMLLSGQGARDDVEHLLSVLDASVADDLPSAREDSATLALCRAVQVVEQAPLDVARARVAAVDGFGFEPTHLTRNTTAARLAARSCREILALRERLQGAPVLQLRGWWRGQAFGSPLLVLSVDASNAVAAPPLAGRWVVAEQGVGLLLTGTTAMIIWASMWETGWVIYDDAPKWHGSLRLHELVMEYGSNSSEAQVSVIAKALADTVSEEVFPGPPITVSRSIIEL